MWGATALAASEQIVKKLDGLKTYYEFLPLNLNGERWLTLNFTRSLEERTIMNLRNNGKPSPVRPFKKLVVAKDPTSDGGIFRVQGAGLLTFCTDQLDGLYDVVTSNHLSGLNFKEIEIG